MITKSKYKNNFIGTIFLVSILLILGVYVYYIDIPKSEKEKKDKEMSEKVIPFEKDSVESFTITNDGVAIKMTLQKDGEWLMNSPVNARGDKSAAEGIISRLQAVTFSSVVDDNPEDLSVYGFSNFSLKISIKTKEWEKTVITGDTTPLGNGVYVKRLDDKRVFLAGTYIRDDLKKGVIDLRDKKVVDIVEERIEGIEFINNKNTKIVLTKEDVVWNIKEPVNIKADKDEVEEILNTIKSFKAAAFIKDNAEDISPYGFNSHINITRDAGKAKIGLLLGKREEDSYYAKLEGSNNVISLDAESVEKIINSDEMTLQDKTIFNIKKEDIDKITLVYKDEEIVLKREKEGNAWRILKPVETGASEMEMSSFVYRIEHLKAKKIIKDAVKTDIQDTTETIIFWGKDSKKMGELTINGPAEGEGHYGRSDSRKDTLIIGKVDVEDLSKRFNDLRDKRIISFKEDDVIKAELLYKDKSIDIVKKGAKKWYVEGEDRLIDETGFMILLWDTKDLKFEQIVSEDGGDLSVYGIDHPYFKISLTEKDSKPKTFIIGKKMEDKNLFYAMTNDSRRIYSVKGDAVTKLTSRILEF